MIGVYFARHSSTINFFLSNLTIGRVSTFSIYFIDNDAIFVKPRIMLKYFYKSIVKTSVFVLILLFKGAWLMYYPEMRQLLFNIHFENLIDLNVGVLV